MFDGLVTKAKLHQEQKRRALKFEEVYTHADQVADYETMGYKFQKSVKKKSLLVKQKTEGEIFEDLVWLKFFSLSPLSMNNGRNFTIGNHTKKKQIDVFAEFNDYVFVVECKFSSSDKPKISRDDIDAFTSRMEEQENLIRQKLGKQAIFIFCTTGSFNFKGTANHTRLIDSGALWFGENELEYIQSLIDSYKLLAYDLFINTALRSKLTALGNKLRIPAMKTTFAGRESYIFSLESNQLKKSGIVPHRSYSSYDSSLASYQRLVKYNRLNKIKEFINNGGYFPNAVITAQLDDVNSEFLPLNNPTSSDVELGVLEFERDRALFNIIDGQHRVFGHSLSDYNESEGLAVILLKGVDTSEQLKLFMEVNHEQKKVNAKLRLDLEEDLNWESKYPSKRMTALISKVIRNLNTSNTSAFKNRIGIGDSSKREFSSMYFLNGLKSGSFLPKSRGHNFIEDNSLFYDVGVSDQSQAMLKSAKRLSSFLENTLNRLDSTLVEMPLSEQQSKFLFSNRGILVFLRVLGDFMNFLAKENKWSHRTSSSELQEHALVFVGEYIEYVKQIPTLQLDKLLAIQGAQVATIWSLEVWKRIAEDFKGFKSEQLDKHAQSNSENIYAELTKVIKKSESLLKQVVIAHMKFLKGEHWDAHFGKIKVEAQGRATEHNNEVAIQGLDDPEMVWHQKLMLIDYKNIIMKHWSEQKDNMPAFSKLIRIPELSSSNSKSDSTQWILDFNELRKKWAHAGTNEYRFDEEDLSFMKIILEHLLNVKSDNVHLQ